MGYFPYGRRSKVKVRSPVSTQHKIVGYEVTPFPLMGMRASGEQKTDSSGGGLSKRSAESMAIAYSAGEYQYSNDMHMRML